MIGVLNYNAGNLKSVESALTRIGATYLISQDPDSLFKCDKLIFPGVGDAKFAMQTLKKLGNDQFLKEFVKSGKPVFGICLGAQIFFSHSEEHDTPCLDLIPGKVLKFDLGAMQNLQMQSELFKVPHMGWNQVDFVQPNHPMFAHIPNHSSFYFVHSYYIQPDHAEVISGLTSYGHNFCSAVAYKNICAAQFHPEKSGEVGLQMLKNFVFGRES